MRINEFSLNIIVCNTWFRSDKEVYEARKFEHVNKMTNSTINLYILIYTNIALIKLKVNK